MAAGFNTQVTVPITGTGQTSLNATTPGLVNKDPHFTATTVQVSGTYTGLSFAFQGTLDGSHWFALAAIDLTTGQVVTGSISPSNSATYGWRIPSENLQGVQMNVTGFSTGQCNAFFQTASFIGVITVPTSTATALTSAVTSTSANALAVGPNGTTNPSFNVDASTASAATGINIKSAAAGGGVAITGISSQGGDAITITGTAATTSTAGGAITIAGAAGGATTGAGGALTLSGGAGTAGNSIGGAVAITAGAGQGTAAGAVATLTAGASGAGATGNGGAVTVTAGAAASTNGTGGAASLIGGLGTGTGAGGAITITSGAAGSTGVAGAVNISVGGATAGVGSALTLTAGNGAGGTNGGGVINLIPGTAVSTGTPGEVQVASTAGLFDAVYAQGPSTVPTTSTSYVMFMANRAYRVKAVSTIASTAGGSGCTVNVVKDTSTNAPGAGTAVLTGAMALSGTANTRVTGTLTGTIATLTMAAGDRLSTTWAGTISPLAGAVVTVTLVPC